MHFHFQTHTAHTQGLTHIFLAVDNEFLRQDVQDLLISRNIHGARSFNHALYIGLRHFFVFNRHHAVRIDALDVTAGNPGIHLANFAIRHQLRFFQGTLNRIHRRFDIHHHALLQAA